MLFFQGILLMLSFVLLLLAALGVGGAPAAPPTRHSLWCWGLAIYVLSVLIGVAFSIAHSSIAHG